MMQSESGFTQRHLWVLIALTLVWGLNWPVMKLGVSHFPPLAFRAWSMWLGIPILAVGLVILKAPFRIPREHWRELFVLSVANMVVWHIFVILGVQALSSGRAAILGYTMPVFSALWGVAFFGAVMSRRAWLGVGAAALGVLLLLWHEFTTLSGAPWGAASVVLAAATWALGVQMLRATQMPVATLTIVFWMTVLTAIVITTASAVFEHERIAALPSFWPWSLPQAAAWWAIAYNAVLIFGYAHAAWNWLARTLPPIASTLSVMLIPVLGVVSGAVWLGEKLHWQDGAAIVLMLIAIASVLWPARQRAA
jgi:drug/metabolite transporter (DMT)-like permease